MKAAPDGVVASDAGDNSVATDASDEPSAWTVADAAVVAVESPALEPSGFKVVPWLVKVPEVSAGTCVDEEEPSAGVGPSVPEEAGLAVVMGWVIVAADDPSVAAGS